MAHASHPTFTVAELAGMAPAKRELVVIEWGHVALGDLVPELRACQRREPAPIDEAECDRFAVRIRHLTSADLDDLAA